MCVFVLCVLTVLIQFPSGQGQTSHNPQKNYTFSPEIHISTPVINPVTFVKDSLGLTTPPKTKSVTSPIPNIYMVLKTTPLSANQPNDDYPTTVISAKKSVLPSSDHDTKTAKNSSLISSSHLSTLTQPTTLLHISQYENSTETSNSSRNIVLHNKNYEHEVESTSGIYYFQIILITLSAFAVVVIAVYLTKQFAVGGVRRRLKSPRRRGGFRKRYSDTSLQMFNIDSIELPNISSMPESHVIAEESEETDAFVQEKEYGELHPMHNPGDGSPQSDGEWI